MKTIDETEIQKTANTNTKIPKETKKEQTNTNRKEQSEQKL